MIGVTTCSTSLALFLRICTPMPEKWPRMSLSQLANRFRVDVVGVLVELAQHRMERVGDVLAVGQVLALAEVLADLGEQLDQIDVLHALDAVKLAP